jgi:RNA polymerase sigma-70 factor, ECF subfamily
VRAKAKIRDARIPYQVPSAPSCRSGWTPCCTWSTWCSTRATRRRRAIALTRADLSGEAIRLGRLLLELLPEPEVMGLLALMLLHESRRARAHLRAGRADPAGRAGPLALGPRADRGGIGAGGAGALHAPLRAVHAAGGHRRGARGGADAAETDWAQIVGLYDVLMRAEPSPVVELNRAAAVAMRDGPEAGLALIDAILARGDLADYHLAHAARADCAGGWAARAEARGRLPPGAGPRRPGARAPLPQVTG